MARPRAPVSATSSATAPANGLVFESPSGRTATRLQDLVDGTTSTDARTLAARAALLPARAGATPWLGIRSTGWSRGDASETEVEPAPATVSSAPSFVRRALVAAIDRAFAGAKRVAVLTGGGVDSSALLALATDWARRDASRSAFGVAVDFGGGGDDRPHLAALEDHLRCEIVRVRPEDAARRFELFEHGVDAAPFTWPAGAFEVEALARAREHGADIAATGAGADGLFDGAPHALADVAMSGHVLQSFVRARRMRAFASRPRVPEVAWVLRPLVGRWVPRALRARWRRPRTPVSAPDWAGPLLREVLEVERERIADTVPPRDARARFEHWRSLEAQEHVVWLKHQEEIAASITRRDPYDDAKLARAVTSLPPAWLLHGDIRRGLFREAIRGLVPDSLRMREDKAYFEEGFTRFVEAAGGFSVVRPYARATHLADLGIADPARLAVAFEELAQNPIDSWGWGTVWPALAVEAFLRTVDTGTR